MSSRIKEGAYIIALGIILANLVISASPTLANFAPLPVSINWLYVVAAVCGFGLEVILNKSVVIFGGVALVVLIAVSIFSGVLIVVALQNNTAFMDLAVLYAIQQSVPRFIFLCMAGFFGAAASLFLKLPTGRL